MRVFTMPTPPISTLDISIDTQLFAEQYMRHMDKAVSQIDGTRLFYDMASILNDRIECFLNIAALPSISSIENKYAEYGFVERLVAAINKGAQSGIEQCPLTSPQEIRQSDMRKWSDKWISAYLWILLKIDFSATYNTDMNDNAGFIKVLVGQINRQEDICFDGAIDLSESNLIATHLDPHEYKALAAEFINAVVATPYTNMVLTKNTYDEIANILITKTHHQEVLLVQQAKRDDCFFIPNKEMQSYKIPMPPLSSLPITLDKTVFAEAMVLMLSQYIKHYADTRMHYKNVRVIGDDIYVDINTSRLPEVRWFMEESLEADFKQDLLAMINADSEQLESGELVTLERLVRQDVRSMKASWISAFMWIWFKYTHISWDKADPKISDEEFVGFIIKNVEERYSQETVEELMDWELRELKNEHSMHHHGIDDVINDVVNRIVLEGNKSPTRRIDTDFIDELIDETTDKLLDLAAEWLNRIRKDDDFIKADDYYM